MAVGDIGTVIDSLEFDAADAIQIAACRVNNTIAAIAYRGVDNDGWLKTVTIDADGNIGNSVIDSLEFDETVCSWPSICHVKGNYYAITYQGNFNHGWLKTVTIDGAGNIGNAVTDSWEFDATNGGHPALINILNNIFAIAYDKSQTQGTIISVNIAADGTITKSAIDTLEFESTDCRTCDICHTTGAIYTVVYSGASLNAIIVSISIDNDGNISNSIIDSLQINASRGTYPRHTYIGNGIIAVVSTDYWSDGWLYTIEIDEAGNIGNAVTDSWEFNEVQGVYCRAMKINANMVCVAFSNGSNHGVVSSVQISNEGAITKSWYDTLEFDSTFGQYANLINTQGNIVSIAYQGPDTDGWIKTTTIELPPKGGAQYLMLMGIG